MHTDFRQTPIFYDHIKSGDKTLILLHGFLEDRTIWKGIIDACAATYSILAIDLPGHGESGSMDKIHSMEDMAAGVLHIMKECKIPSAHIMGHSMGGYVGLAFAELFADHCDGLILLNSSCEADSDDRRKNRERALKIIRKTKDMFVSMAINNLFSEASRTKYPDEIAQLIQKAQAMKVVGIEAAIRGMIARPDRTDVLRNWKKPKHIICGDADPIIPLEQSLRMAKTTQTPISVMEGSHMSWLENQAEIVKILHFID